MKERGERGRKSFDRAFWSFGGGEGLEDGGITSAGGRRGLAGRDCG